MAKYSFEEKMQAVHMVLNMRMSDYAAASELGISRSCIRRWVERYNQFGEEGLRLKHGTYTGEFKQSVIEYMHENNLSLIKTAVMFGIPTDVTVGEWERIYYTYGPEGLRDDGRGRGSKSSKDRRVMVQPQVEEDLIAEVQRLRMENMYLKNRNIMAEYTYRGKLKKMQ